MNTILNTARIVLLAAALVLTTKAMAEPHPACKSLPETECVAKQIEGVNICSWVKPRQTATKDIAGYCRVSGKSITHEQATKIRAALSQPKAN